MGENKNIYFMFPKIFLGQKGLMVIPREESALRSPGQKTKDVIDYYTV